MKTLLRILKYVLEYKALVAIAVVCSLMYAALSGFSIYLIGPFLNNLFPGKDFTAKQAAPIQDIGALESIKIALSQKVDHMLGSGTPIEILNRLCIIVIVVIVLKNLFSYLQGYIMAYVEQGVVKNLRQDLYASYHQLPLRYFQRTKTGDLISRVISDCTTINNNLNSSLLNLMREPITIATFLFLMVVINWKLTLFTFLIAPPGGLIIGWIGNKLRHRTTHAQHKISDVTSVLEETISGIRVVKAFAMEKFEVGRFLRANTAYFRSLLRLFRIRRLSSPVTEVLGVIMVVMVLWFGGKLVLEDNWLEPGDFMQFIFFMFMLMQSVKRLSEVNVKMQVGIAASRRVFEIIDHPSDITDPPEPIAIESVREGVQFKNVWYEYEPGVPVLRDINLKVKVGENIAIVGPSGGGKSTLVDLLPRFFDPIRGTVEIEGNDIREYSLDDLRRLFGIVTQETILFNDTIRANIAYGRPDISMDDIVTAAKTANAHGFIEAFENGYDTVVGDRGTKLSGGQRQRLVIARAILKNPPVLIFDEATSALDSKAEAEVQAAIDRLMAGRTSFVIAHRLSTIQSATRIIVIDKGRIIEEGPHAELYEKDDLYRRLYDLQFSPISGDK